MRQIIAGFLLTAALAHPALSWGVRAHSVINRVAIETLPSGAPAFLAANIDYIAYRSIIPDTWRGVNEPFLKIVEDPNHGWFREQSDLMKAPPRSRYEFVIALHHEYERLKGKEPQRARLTNVRWTGTLPYAAIETYERMKTGMRMWRATSDPQRKAFIESDIAHEAGRLGHYTADAAQPLHVSIHHDGWQGPNPKGYTTDPRIHGRMESAFVDLIELTPADIRERVGSPKVLADPFQSIVDHLNAAFNEVETVYQLDLSGAWSNNEHAAARELVYRCTASGARLLRDLVHTAWVESGNSAPAYLMGKGNPASPENPAYNPETGSAPASPRK
jgi:hypothetical protein